MTTDLEHLHKVVRGEVGGRRCGKTYARCHELAGVIELGNKHIFCGISAELDLGYLLPMISTVFDEHGLKISRVAKDTIKAGEATIKFITPERLDRAGRGVDAVYVAMAHLD